VTEDAPPPPTFDTFRRVQAQGKAALSEPQQRMVAALAERYRFFHWHLAFRDVFKDEGEGGFDVVLGNPPWERIKLQEKEFFADKDAEIANARTASARGKLIKKLPQTDPELHMAYTDALRESEAASHFLRESGRYPLSAVGDINTYQVFAGLVRQIVGAVGRVGVVIPSGIATDYYNQDYFSTIVEEQELVSFYDFENRRKLFPEVDSRMKFSLLTLTGGEVEEAEFAFFLHTTDDLAEPERRFALSPDEVALMNPNTGTVPVFRTRRDAELTKKFYRAAPVLVNEETGENPWNIRFSTMFHMTNDSHLFHTREELEAQGFTLERNRFVSGNEICLPLYEARMTGQFDHRAASIEVNPDNLFRQAITAETSRQQHRNPNHCPVPRFWVDESIADDKLPQEKGWWLTYRTVTSATNARTSLFCIVPKCAASNMLPLTYSEESVVRECCLLATVDSFALDYVLRQKFNSQALNFYILNQLPVLPPDRYTSDLLDVIVPRVVELTYTAWDLQPFAQDVLDEVGEETWARWFADAPVHDSPPPSWATGDTPAPFVWDEQRRAALRAELDALYAHLYGLTRDELAYILDTFPIVKRKDEAQYGEYRTKRMILERYEETEPLAR
jgi:hypothetical protein